MYLNNHTYYSLRYGTFNEQDLIELALENNVKTIVLTDINNTSACLNFMRLCVQHQLHGVLGIDFRNKHQQEYVGIAKNNEGFQELNTFLSYHLENKIPFPAQAPAFQNAYIIYPFKKVVELEKVRFRESEFIGTSMATLRKLPFTSYVKMLDKMVVLQTVTFRSKKIIMHIDCYVV
ncbi:error-prone repair homolog of DNA polymerase III alpha subunit [Nonlabens ulvanivorans]|nr:error-prone repair homolog of DNA polymerase III alpha subunit [Nonlabens ulvanivorans]